MIEIGTKKGSAILAKILVFVFFLPCIKIYAQKFDNLALTPPMGWNSWNKFSCNINEKIIREVADVMVSSGMKDAGYQYINIDDCWQGSRDSLGFIYPDTIKFPSGMKALADYVHSKGLKIGIYSDAGDKTCGGYSASRGHEYQDAITYAKWGMDYLKYDWCNTENLNAEGAYTTMRDALHAAGRPVVFSICEWGTNKPWLWAKNVGHLWRTTGDIYPCFDCIEDHVTWKQWGVMQILDMQKGLREYAGPGHWNDPDMLEVGNGMTNNEDRAHFSIWCMLAAPLIAGNDLRNMSKETRDILTNKDVISIDQDSLGIEAFKYSSVDNVQIWCKPLEKGDWAVCFLNGSTKPRKVSFNWNKENIIDNISKKIIQFDQFEYEIKNLWTGKEIGTTKKILIAEISGHDVLMIRLIKPQIEFK
jgi:alpha-galactosidase